MNNHTDRQWYSNILWTAVPVIIMAVCIGIFLFVIQPRMFGGEPPFQRPPITPTSTVSGTVEPVALFEEGV